MKRRWKITLGLLAVLAVVLAVNTVTTGSQTKEAEVTVEGGQVLDLSRGDVQVTDSGEPASGRPASQPIVLLHGYACSLAWFDRLEPLLAEDHRVIRVDLLGHGGSEKPESGYEIEEQAAVVAEALNQLEVDGALVAGNSMGGMVATSLAEQASQLVDRVALIGIAPNTTDFGRDTSLPRQATYVPVLGHALWRVTPDFAIRQGYEELFPAGYDLDDAFEDPDRVVDDLRAMTYTSYSEASAGAGDYVDELPLDERFKQTPVPLLAMFGAEDSVFDAERSLEGFSDVPGARTELIDDAGHAPQVDSPEEVAALLEDFSAGAAAPVGESVEADERRRGRSPEPGAQSRQGQDRRSGPGERGERNGNRG